MRKIDKLGRLVVPLELRRKYGLNIGSRVEFLDTGDSVIIKPSEPACRICRADVSEGSEFPLCESCISKIINRYSNKK